MIFKILLFEIFDDWNSVSIKFQFLKNLQKKNKSRRKKNNNNVLVLLLRFKKQQNYETKKF